MTDISSRSVEILRDFLDRIFLLNNPGNRKKSDLLCCIIDSNSVTY